MITPRPTHYLPNPLVCPHCGYEGLMIHEFTHVIMSKRWQIARCNGCNGSLATKDEVTAIKKSDLPFISSRRDIRYK